MSLGAEMVRPRAPAVAAQAAAIVELASQILRQLATPAWLHAVTE